MKKIWLVFCFLGVLFLPTVSGAAGMEIAAGAWNQSPQGDLAFDEIAADDDLDLEDDLNYKNEWRVSGRLKIDMPWLIPNLYVMATPMEFDETGRKTVDFKFGDETFAGDVEFDSTLKLNHLDVALYYGLPFLESATAGMFHLDIGINVKIVDFKAEIEQEATGLKESESYLLPLPMAFVATQIRPFEKLALELEGRGITYTGDSYYSLLGRVKVKPYGPVFVAGGYRYDRIDIDKQDVKVDATFSGPFAEIGLEF
ncbi:MAG: TIGR04219 family outer membrane beta-barrel protein [Desulfobacterales bacterium]|nr:MAG: TIGR04219 family outer membrane beta-barrel protein [Desulfobacterales bacterium]